MRRLARVLLGGMLLAAGATLLAAEQVPVVRFEVTGFEVGGDNPLGRADTEAALAPFLGPHEGLEGLLAAADALQARLLEAGYAFHRVILPQQTLRAGRVTLQVVRFRIRRLDIEGNEHFSRANVLRALPGLAVGASPNTRELSRALRLANEHPMRSLDVRFSDSEEEQGINARIKVEDRRPWALFTALNNTGTRETDELRLTVGAQHTNLFDRDHALTASYTTSPREPASVKQWAFFYEVPFYRLGGRLSLSYVDSSVDSGLISGIQVSGAGRFWTARYRHLLASIGAYRHELEVSLADRLFIDNLTPGAFPGAGVNVRSRPLELRYGASYVFPGGLLDGYLAYAHNLPSGHRNDGPTYAARVPRSGATVGWDVWRLGASLQRSLPRDWALAVRLDAQLANQPLISGEQFGVGGGQSVRGYEEREASGDSGYLLRSEIWSPALGPGVRALGFYDRGYVRTRNPTASDIDDQFIASWGLGVRWAWRGRIAFEADWALALEDIKTAGAHSTRAGRNKVHFSLFYRF